MKFSVLHYANSKRVPSHILPFLVPQTSHDLVTSVRGSLLDRQPPVCNFLTSAVLIGMRRFPEYKLYQIRICSLERKHVTKQFFSSKIPIVFTDNVIQQECVVMDICEFVDHALCVDAYQHASRWSTAAETCLAACDSCSKTRARYAPAAAIKSSAERHGSNSAFCCYANNFIKSHRLSSHQRTMPMLAAWREWVRPSAIPLPPAQQSRC